MDLTVITRRENIKRQIGRLKETRRAPDESVLFLKEPPRLVLGQQMFAPAKVNYFSLLTRYIVALGCCSCRYKVGEQE